MKRNFLRFAGYLVILQLTIFVGFRQETSQAGERPVGRAADRGLSPLGKHTDMSEMFEGTVVEVINAGRYAYIHIDMGEKRIWVAAPAFDGKLGDTVLVPPGVQVADFQSKRLNRRFERVLFVGGIRRVNDRVPDQSPPPLPEGHPPSATRIEERVIPPPKDALSEGPAIEHGSVETVKGLQTVSEVITTRKTLAGKEIRVRARVVKFTPNIMGKNWIHVQDGSGDDGTSDLIVTTNTMVSVGDVVLIQGIVSVDRDFGYGLEYPVIIEDAEVIREQDRGKNDTIE